VVIPAALAENVTKVWNDAGRQWLAELPDRLTGIARTWDLEIGTPYELSYHWVCRATRADGTPAVLKVGVPGAEHLRAETATLRAWDGHGAVRLLEYDAAAGALLLERAEPGTPASSLVPQHDERATAAAIEVAGRLHMPVDTDPPVPDVAGQAADFAAHLREHPTGGPLPRGLVVRAVGLFAELTASATERVYLHGDLHHDNVLAADREPWLVIDPHGVLGDPAYDVGSWLHNPDPPRGNPEVLRLLPRRIEQLADGLALPIERVVAYGFVKAVLSEVWTCEDGGVPGGSALDVATALLPRLA